MFARNIVVNDYMFLFVKDSIIDPRNYKTIKLSFIYYRLKYYELLHLVVSQACHKMVFLFYKVFTYIRDYYLAMGIRTHGNILLSMVFTKINYLLLYFPLFLLEFAACDGRGGNIGSENDNKYVFGWYMYLSCSL